MRILALITARGGSKRLPGKNIRVLGGKPLIVWTIDAVRDMSDICDILVSTDDPAIAAICASNGAFVPWLRPAELATDTASGIDVALHGLEWYEREKGIVDGLLLLQPTSPFRTRKTVLHGIELFKTRQHHAVIGVSPTQSHPMWCFRISDDSLQPFISGSGLKLRSQDLPPAYVVNGSFYLIKPVVLKDKQTFFVDPMIPLITENFEEAIDIDTEFDWNCAEIFLKGLRPVEG